MMKQNYNNKAKYRSAWIALVLLMITALPITAQNAGDRFQVDGYHYQVVDATAKTVKVTWANQKATTAQATKQVLESETADLPDQWKGYKGTVPATEKDEYILDKAFKANIPDADQKHKINVVVIPASVHYKNKDWTVVAIGSYAFINERKIDKAELPATIESIEDCAFYQCSVTMLNFPESLKYIGWRAFYKTNLAPYTVTTKKNSRATKHTKKYQPIEILGETAIGPQAFEGSFSTSTFACPKITFVGYQAFKGAKFRIYNRKPNVSIPASAKIGEETTDATIKAMYNNLDPAVTDYRSGVESFAEYSYDNSKVTASAISLEEGPTTIPTGMFEKAFTDLHKFVIPLSVTSIGERAFANTGIKSFNDLSKVTKIGARAFENGVMSGDFVIEEQVEEVGDGAFAGNTNLTGFTLKGSANCKIGAGILEGCPDLEFIDLRNVKNEDFKKNLKNLSRESNSRTITAGLPTHTLVFLPKATGITIADGQDVNFVKSDGTCTKLSLQDGTEYEFLSDIKANEVVYNSCKMIINNQTINRGYNTALEVARYEGDNSLTSYRDFSAFASGKNCFTIFLPYAVTLPDGIRAYDLNYLTKEGDIEKYVFKSIPDGSTLKGNRPYLLRITDGNSHTSQEFKAVDNLVKIAASGNDKYRSSGRLKPSGFVPATSDQSFCFYGSTEMSPRYWNEDESVSLSISPHTLGHDKEGNDLWKRLPGKSYDSPKLLPPFRGFIMGVLGTTAAKQFVLLTTDSETTGINDVTGNTDAQQGAQRIYTIDGRYVGTNFDSLPSGMYIMKGKKTLKTK
ncbi:leucine-rich repeat domain-containing protein [Prevotella disiens]|uniref:leucine-rich repeat domain-containing protein n=1 Tax=Prevotella disiens TaxID=28130 RepID=UPI0009DCDCC7|nr:leucine-rich repeat domain-containing protein [Prevotella disiens]